MARGVVVRKERKGRKERREGGRKEYLFQESCEVELLGAFERSCTTALPLDQEPSRCHFFRDASHRLRVFLQAGVVVPGVPSYLRVHLSFLCAFWNDFFPSVFFPFDTCQAKWRPRSTTRRRRGRSVTTTTSRRVRFKFCAYNLFGTRHSLLELRHLSNDLQTTSVTAPRATRIATTASPRRVGVWE